VNNDKLSVQRKLGRWGAFFCKLWDLTDIPMEKVIKIKIRGEKMKKLHFSILLSILFICMKQLHAQDVSNLQNIYPILSMFYNVPDDDQKDFEHLNFRYGWTSQAPYTIAVQFSNAGYDDKTFKFAIKDVTLNKMVVLGKLHKSTAGYETLKANSDGTIWSGSITSLNDSFALRVWNSDGKSLDQAPISILSAWIPTSVNTPTNTSGTTPLASLTPSTLPQNTAAGTAK
jgi:hypothetical protein